MEIVKKGKSNGWKSILKFLFPYLIGVGTLQIIGALVLGLDLKNISSSSQTPVQLTVMTFITMIATVGLVWLFTTKVDKKPFSVIGFSKALIGKDMLWGILMGLVIMLSGYVILIQIHEIQFVKLNFQVLNLFLNVAIFVMVALTEEILVRGYFLRNLMVSFNSYLALFISALIFSLMHLSNPNVTPVSLTIIFLSGLVLGLPYVYSKNIWFPVALHFSWNFFQGPIFGFNVSGTTIYKLIETRYKTANYWNGGEFGFEGSVLAVFFLLSALAVVYFLFRNTKPAESDDIQELEIKTELVS